MASSSSATLPQPIRYNVFLSFRGEDIRNDLRSHLYDALCRNQIFTFIDDNLRRGDNISSLFTAIEESIISVIIFSENYADSKWCLKELAKILQCRKLNGQIVIPVFYGVDPSHVRKQTGKFGLAFAKLRESLLEGEMDLDLDEVRSHLKEAADISGWNSQIISPESKLIKAIVGDILNKLNRKTLNLPSSLVGIGSHVKQVETLLCLESPQFRIVGLWGMGGIGKTTIAQAVNHRICSTFDGFYFVEKVSEKLKNQSVGDLREKIVLKLFEEESLNMGSRTLLHDFIMKQLQRKKVLIVLDDVDDAIEAMKLLAGIISGGSRILVTSRNIQVLKNIVDDENLIYEVEGLNEEESLQLFSLGAFKQNHPTSDRQELSRKVLSYAKGNPLALVVLGHALYGKSKEEWVSALDGLGEESFSNIQKVLRISYDALICEQEKKIFLDISSFLVGKKLDFVVAYYKGSLKRIEFKISNLIDKSLITVSKTKELEMHDLLKKMGCSIESTKRLKERVRIWDLKDLTQISKVRKGSSMIEAISVNLCQGERISEFDCSVLARLDRLRFLEFHHREYEESKVKFCWEGFRGFPKELRYFRWDVYPQKSLPLNFCAEDLVELHMPRTTIRKLWTGKQNIVNLKVINLTYADKLVEFPDISEGRNIQEIYLCGCKSLVKLPPSIHLPKLEVLILSGCSSVKSVSEIMEPMESLSCLDLSGCTRLKRLPNNHSFHNLKSIEELHLDETAITELPSSIQHLICLKHLGISGCENLTSLPSSIHNLRDLRKIKARYLRIVDLPESIGQLLKMEYLDLSGCESLRSLPASMKQLSQLRYLVVAGCSNLSSLPELPSSLETLNANGCVSLKTISSACFSSESKTRILKFANCSNWDKDDRTRVLNIAFSNLQYNLDPRRTLEENGTALEFDSSILPIRRIPQSIIFLQAFLQCIRLRNIAEESRKLVKIASLILQRIRKSFIFALRILTYLIVARAILHCISPRGISKEIRRLVEITSLILQIIRKSFALKILPALISALTILLKRSPRFQRIFMVLIFALVVQEERIREFTNLDNLGSQLRRTYLDIIRQHNSNPSAILHNISPLIPRTILDTIDQYELTPHEFEIVLPYTEIPLWFCGSQSVGSSLTLKLPMYDQCYRFVFCVVIKPKYANSINAEDYSKLRSSIFINYLECYVDDAGYGLPVTSCELDQLSSDIEHVLLWRSPWNDKLRKYFGREVSLQFRDKNGEVEVTRCGLAIF